MVAKLTALTSVTCCVVLHYLSLILMHFTHIYALQVKVVLKSTTYSQTVLINVLLLQPTLLPG